MINPGSGTGSGAGDDEVNERWLKTSKKITRCILLLNQDCSVQIMTFSLDRTSVKMRVLNLVHPKSRTIKLLPIETLPA